MPRKFFYDNNVPFEQDMQRHNDMIKSLEEELEQYDTNSIIHSTYRRFLQQVKDSRVNLTDKIGRKQQ